MDLYALLGVTRDASADAIGRAYRRLARRYHPGVNPGDRDAEQLFRQIRLAFEVLGDLERRREYDRGVPMAPVTAEVAVAFEGFDFSSPAEGPQAATFSELFSDVFRDAARHVTAPREGPAIDARLQISFEDAVRGGSFRLSVVRHDRCVPCHATGRMPIPPVSCPVCGGAGAHRWARGHMVFTKDCDACGGSGRSTAQTCATCGGLGTAPRSEVVTVATPPGLETGARLVIPGRGHTGAHGGPPGDLYVSIDVAPHPFFRRSGRDLHLTLPIAIHEAAFGARVDVPTLSGPVKVKVPPGTSSGRQLTVQGHGMPAAGGQAVPGDLVVELQIVLPPVRDERSRELLKEFGRLNDADVRAALFSPDDRG